MRAPLSNAINTRVRGPKGATYTIIAKAETPGSRYTGSVLHFEGAKGLNAPQTLKTAGGIESVDLPRSLASSGMILTREGGEDFLLESRGLYVFNSRSTLAQNNAGKSFSQVIAEMVDDYRARNATEWPAADLESKATPQPVVSSQVIVTTMAGIGRAVDGVGSGASFASPFGVATDAEGNVYVADSWNAKIRKISPSGVVNTLAGAGPSVGPKIDGPASRATFRQPEGIFVDSFGNVYVADTWDNKIRKISRQGVVTTLAGTGEEGDRDGAGNQALFNHPSGIAVDRNGTVYVVDSQNHKIRKISPEGQVSTLAGTGERGETDGAGSTATFNYPFGIAVDSSGTLYVVGDMNKVRKISPDGLVSSISVESDARFSTAQGVAVDRFGDLYVTVGDSIRKIRSDGRVTTLAGSGTRGSIDGPGDIAWFSYPVGIALDSQGNVLVADSNNDKIRKIDSQGRVSTLAGIGNRIDGTGSRASFSSGPSWLAFDGSRDLFVADGNILRKVTPEGSVSTVAGCGWNCGGGEFYFAFSAGVAVDKNGTAYVSASDQNQILKTSPGGQFSIHAGSGEAGDLDGSKESAAFNEPRGLAFDGSGNLYVADNNNHTIRKISLDGVVSTFAGVGIQGSADGIGQQAAFHSPQGLVADQSGNVYVADAGNHKIRKITPQGMVSTLAGSGKAGARDGSGQAAAFNGPVGLCIDSQGNLYVADMLNHKIRKITPEGRVSTLAGSGVQGSSDGSGAKASFFWPTGVAIDASGDLCGGGWKQQDSKSSS